MGEYVPSWLPVLNIDVVAVADTKTLVDVLQIVVLCYLGMLLLSI